MYIGEKETGWLLTVLVTSQIFVRGINGFVSASGTAGAIVSLLCCAIVLVYFWIIDKLKFSHDVGMFDMMRESYGNSATVIIGAVLTVLSALNCSMRLKMFSVAVADIVLPDSPQVYVMLFFAVAMLVAVSVGLEALTRYALPAGMVIALLSAAVVAFNFDSYKLTNIFPLLGRGGEGIASSSGMISMFSDFFYIYILADFFRKKHAVKRVSLKAVALSGIIITSITFFYILAVPYPSSAKFDYPFFRLASLANTSVLFQRLDAFVYVIWLFSGFICTGALALFTIMIFSQTFKLSDYKGIVHAFIFLISAFSLTAKNRFSLVNSLFSTFVFSLLAVTAVVYRFKIISGRNTDEE